MKQPNSVSSMVTSIMLVSAVACSADAPTTPPTASLIAEHGENKVLMCHEPDQSALLIEVSAAARGAHENHGDYVARFVVDKASPALGDGIHFARVGDAVAAARTVRIARDERETGACRITVAVAAGIYPGSTSPNVDPDFELLPITLDVPDLTLQGAFEMQIDANGRATGESGNGASSTFDPSPPLAKFGMGSSEPIFMVDGNAGGFSAHGLIIEGFTFRSGHDGVDALIGGVGILVLRVHDLIVRDNRFEGGFSESIDLRAASASVNRNHLSGRGGGCDLCLAGPGNYEATNNRFLLGGTVGILVLPTVILPVPATVQQWVLPTTATVNALLVNNEVRNHQAVPVGVGFRIGAVGVGASNVAGTTRVVARDNLLADNRFGLIVEAGFQLVGTPRRGDVDLTLQNNTFANSCHSHVLVALSRHSTALGINAIPPLLNSNYTIALGGNIAWSDVWFNHPAGLGNTLTVDDAVIATGSHLAYDPAKVCP